MMKVGIYLGQNHVGVEERPVPEVGPKDRFDPYIGWWYLRHRY